MDQRSDKKPVLAIMLMFLLFAGSIAHAQNEGNKLAEPTEKNDSTYRNFYDNRFKVAKAQINLLKNGALLVRLKTNANTINRLKNAGNIDLATQVERETQMENLLIMKAYRQEFTFCPVYFFYSDKSDSVKHQKLSGIFLDSNLVVNPSIVCNASFYLIAEQGSIYESSLGLVPLSQAGNAVEKGTSTKEVAIVVKNRFFIQLHKPFPYFQKGYGVKSYRNYVRKFNEELKNFYTKNAGFSVTPEIADLVY